MIADGIVQVIDRTIWHMWRWYWKMNKNRFIWKCLVIIHTYNCNCDVNKILIFPAHSVCFSNKHLMHNSKPIEFHSLNNDNYDYAFFLFYRYVQSNGISFLFIYYIEHRTSNVRLVFCHWSLQITQFKWKKMISSNWNDKSITWSFCEKNIAM